MCVPNVAQGFDTVSKTVGLSNLAMNLTSSLSSNITNYISSKENLKYRTQIALNNAQTAKNEALRQKQLGIENARLEKIKGIKEASALRAKNAAGGLDSDSLTSEYSYFDVLEQAKISADLTKKEYDLSASEYFKQANSYLGEVNAYRASYNKGFINNAFSALGKVQKVANDWYQEKEENSGNYGGFF